MPHTALTRRASTPKKNHFRGANLPNPGLLEMPRDEEVEFRFSGHETFPCRYAWLPKAYTEIAQSPAALSDDEAAMIALGVGKNMVRSIRFWLQTTSIAHGHRDGTFMPTEFGHQLLGSRGLDPFLEDIRTLWLLHWKISSHVRSPLFAWDFLLSRWPEHEFSRETVLNAFRREARKLGRDLSDVTLEQHFDVFLHTYVPTRGRKGDVQEDNLDCPLVELELIRKVGERSVNGTREPVYAFRTEEKPEISSGLFTYCLFDYWQQRFPSEQTLGLKEVASGAGSPGRIFKLPESDVRDRLERIATDSSELFTYKESASLQQLTRGHADLRRLLSRVYA